MKIEFIDKAEAYLQDKLSKEERTAFENQMAQSDELRKIVADQKMLHDGMKILAYKQQFKKISEKERLVVEAQTSQIPDRPVLWGRVAAAAVISLTILTGGIYFVRNLAPADTQSEVAGRENEIPPGKTDSLRNGDLPNRTIPTQELAINEKLFNNYFEIRPHRSPVYINDAGAELEGSNMEDSVAIAKDSLSVYEGIKLLGERRPKQALAAFQTTTMPGHWKACADWYSALAYLLQHQNSSALPIIRRIAVLKGHPYQREAAKLLYELEPEK